MAQGIFNLKQVNQAIRQGAWSAFNPPQFVEYLIVAGGGGGSCGNAGGGGGAGGLLTSIVTVTPGASYSVTVGAGGAGAPQNNDNVLNGSSGVNSVFGSISATGGGGGAGNVRTGLTGGSGGGAGGSIYGSLNPLVGQSVSGQGNSGGMSASTAGGGGGGAGTVGSSSRVDNLYAADGGAGIASSISGTTTVYAGGGGGGFNYALSNSTFYAGGNGGSGIVVVRYPGNIVFYTGGTVNYNNGYISHIFNSNGTLAPTTPAPYNTSYQISRSLRFNRADTNTLTRTPAGAGSRTTYSLSFWIKNPFSSGNDNPFWGQFDSNRESLAFSGYSYSHNPIVWIPFTGFEYRTTQGFRDNSAWYHVVAVGDSTNATAGDRARLYINGVRVTDFAASPTITQNSQTGQLNTAVLHYIGQQWYGDGGLTGFYLTEMHFIDGQALTPASFGATSTTTGVWAPIKYAGTYGTNGFYINFSDNSNNTAATLGKDYSGNGNNWTPNNFSVTAGAGNDSMVDTPTPYGFDTGVGGEVRGNYCTLNPLGIAGAVPSNGNLSISSTSTQGNRISTFLLTSGKWYWEGKGEGYVGAIIGVGGEGYTTSLSGSGSKSIGYWYGDQAYWDGGSSGTGTAYTSSDIIGIALDMDIGNVKFYKNNTLIHNLTFGSGTVPNLSSGVYPGYNVGAGTQAVDFNFGQRPFTYTAPSGFKAICTQNLPTPAIGGTSETLANEFFNVVTWTGTGTSSARSITGVGFQPDFVWSRPRSVAYQHNLYDAVRGSGKRLNTADYAAEVSNATNGYLSSFDTDGFSTTAGATNNENWNQTSATYVAWNWRAGNNSGSANTVLGSIASVVSANPRSKFSIVSYTGNGTSGSSVGHGLDATPSMIIVKQRSAGLYNWRLYHSSLTAGYNMWLNLTNPQFQGSGDDRGYISGVSPTKFTLTNGTTNGDAVNASGVTFIAYCWAQVPGYSAFGSYTGNGSADGTFVHTGFRPAFLMIKRYDSGSSADWQILDTTRDVTNVAGYLLQPNASNAESNATPVLDFLSNGFKNRNTYNVTNASGGTYIYMAFAESPFKYSLAR